MRTKLFITLSVAAALVASQISNAQIQPAPASTINKEFRGNLSAAAEWEFAKDLKLEGEYTLYSKDKFAGIKRQSVNINVAYSPIKPLSIGAGYCYIGRHDNNQNLKSKHRIYVNATGSLKTGAWKFSLKENLQLTNKAYDINRYQNVQNLLELESRFKVAYKGFIHWEPYAFVEMRNCFNAPSFTAEYNEQKGKYTDYQFLGYSDTYINRIRGVLGVEWKINKHHSIDFRFQEDYFQDKEIDTNAEGTKLKSYTWDKDLISVISAGYKFSF